jgi:serine/threonine-protein kinase
MGHADRAHDDAFAQYVAQTGIAGENHLAAARKLQAERPALAIADALVQLGHLTADQREAVEKKLGERHVQQLGPYRLVRKLGEGGMGAVYLADDTTRNRRVALKVLPKQQSKDGELVKRFHREARAAIELTHENIAGAYEAGEDRGYPYYAMEYCEGETLRQRLDRAKRLSEADALAIAVQLARGLGYAHAHGLIHRDVKPDNILVTKDGVAKILDLGLVKHIDDVTVSFKTATGMAMGTPHYLSPEQAEGSKSIDGRADIYSLGATLYHLVAGQVPFEGSSIFEVVAKHVTNDRPNPAKIRPELSDGIARIIQRMMAIRPADRYQDCDEVLEDLEAVAAGRDAPLLLEPVAPPPQAAPPPPRQVAPVPRRTPVPVVPIVAGAGVIVVAIAVAAVLMGGGADTPANASAPKPDPFAALASPPPPVTPPAIASRPEPSPPPVAVPELSAPETTPLPAAPASTSAQMPPSVPRKTRLPVPSAEQLQAALAVVRERHKGAAAASLVAAADVEPDPAVCYALLWEARATAARGEDYKTALDVVARLLARFDDDELVARIEIVRAAPEPRSAEAATRMRPLLMEVLARAMGFDRYRDLAPAWPKLEAAVRVSKDDALRDTVAFAKVLEQEYATVQSAADRLRRNPADALASTLVGRYVCFAKSDWDHGLPLLAAGENRELALLARDEMAAQKGPAMRVALCRAWIKYARDEKKGSLRRGGLLERARKHLPADPKEREPLQREIDELAGVAPPQPPPAPATNKPPPPQQPPPQPPPRPPRKGP